MKKIAVIGCGGIAQAAHLPFLASLQNVQIKYACDLVRSKALLAKEKYPSIENVATDYREVLQDPDVDAVYVLTPNDSHYTITMDALLAGKDVFCEKPIATQYSKALEMAKEAKKQGRILNIGVCNRFHRSVELLQEMNRQGKFGSIYHVYCSFRGHRAVPGLGGPYTTKVKSGGGVLIDWGIHYFDLILYVLGGAKIQNVTCDIYQGVSKEKKEYQFKEMWAQDSANIEDGIHDVEDFASGYIRTDKASISFNGAWAQNIETEDRYIDFLGDKGGARLTYCGNFTFFDGQTMQTYTPEYNAPNFYLRESESFIESIITRKQDRCGIDSVLESARLLEALYRSAEERKEVQLIK